MAEARTRKEIILAVSSQLLIGFKAAIVPEVQLGGGPVAAHAATGPAGALTQIRRTQGID